MTVPLVPLGDDYGDRQGNIEAQRQAQLPLEVSAQRQDQAAPRQARRRPGDPLGFDPLTQMKPLGGVQEGFAQPTFGDRMRAALETSPNPVVREAARRVLR